MQKPGIQTKDNKINTASYDISTAFRPDMSVFVSANAGAGKTSLLTGRVLSLLLHGIEPSKILCLTFTNAAAAEMSNRVLEELGRWVMANDTALAASLEKLTGGPPAPHIMQRARSLFAAVLESPEGVRIQTIHGFGQSLLRRFPLEAGISPHFSVMDTGTQNELLKEARLRLFARAQSDDPALQESLLAIAHGMSELTLTKLLEEIIRQKSKFQSLLASFDGVPFAIDRIYRQLGIDKHASTSSLIETHFVYDRTSLETLRAMLPALLQGKQSDQKTGQALASWLEKESAQEREAMLPSYIDAFLTQEGEARKRLFTKDTLDEAQAACLQEEQQRVLRFRNDWNALGVAQSTTHMLRVADALLALYEALKRQQVQMDYDDLILAARNLLQRPGIAPWILYKLDGGVDHVLIDEAQDTSPVQWQIVTALTEEFFSGLGRSEQERSLFVVGDEKQSIYSFQGADPVALGRMQRYFSQQISDAGKQVQTLSLTRSYRSAKEVLLAVDSIFSYADAREGLRFDDPQESGRPLEHIATRLDHPGLVELWPLITPQEDQDEGAPPRISQLAWRVADQIQYWLKEGLYLPAKGRSAQPGDIMVLVRTRTAFVDRLVSALKRRDIPVAGLDRMMLGDNLAVEDLVAFGQCLLLPEDDLTLACVLKSPICNIDEADLFSLAWGRGKASLWQRLRERSGEAAYQEAYELITQMRGKADFIAPYELYSYLLDTLGMRARFTGRMGSEYNDPIDEFLGQALLFERSHTPSLQGFIHWLAASNSEIKRDMEQSRDTVRIMTVHGAKGLQAPIVILPDTMEPHSQPDILLWQEDERLPELPFWPRSRTQEEQVCAQLRSARNHAQMCEYRRQLYVALTRAEDQLYICGASSYTKLNPHSWYHYIRQGLEPIATPFEAAWNGQENKQENSQGLRLGPPPELRRTSASGTRQETHVSQEGTVPAHLSFLLKQAPREPAPPQPLVPSRMKGEEPAAASPLQQQGQLYQRGTLIHRLLQYLPDIEISQRAQAAANIASLYRRTLDEPLIQHCIDETLRIISHEPFGFLFSEGSMAEAPIAGCVAIGGKEIAVAGQIDRLYISEKNVWIVDYKSGRQAPGEGEPVPPHYLRQMRLYQLLMQRLYPEKQIECGLLWTSGPRLTRLEKAQLDEIDLSTYI